MLVFCYGCEKSHLSGQQQRKGNDGHALSHTFLLLEELKLGVLSLPKMSGCDHVSLVFEYGVEVHLSAMVIV